MCTFLEATVDPDTVRDGAVQGPRLVVMLGREALLQPVVEVETPGGAALPQLLEAAQGPQGHPHGKGLALLVKADLPVVLASVDRGVSCDVQRTDAAITCYGTWTTQAVALRNRGLYSTEKCVRKSLAKAGG